MSRAKFVRAAASPALLVLMALAGPRVLCAQGMPLGPEFRVNTFTTNAQARRSVASDAAGNFVVVWQSQIQDGSVGGVYAQRYSPILPVELQSFRVE